MHILEITNYFLLILNRILTGIFNLFGRHLTYNGEVRRISSTTRVKINKNGLFKFLDKEGNDNTKGIKVEKNKYGKFVRATKYVSLFAETDACSTASDSSSEEESEQIQGVEEAVINIGILGLLAAFPVQGSCMNSYGGGTLLFTESMLMKGTGEARCSSMSMCVNHMLQEGKDLDPIKTDENGYYTNQSFHEMMLGRKFYNMKGDTDNFNYEFREARISKILGMGDFHPDGDEEYRREKAIEKIRHWRRGEKERNKHLLDGNLPTKQVMS